MVIHSGETRGKHALSKERDRMRTKFRQETREGQKTTTPFAKKSSISLL